MRSTTIICLALLTFPVTELGSDLIVRLRLSFMIQLFALRLDWRLKRVHEFRGVVEIGPDSCVSFCRVPFLFVEHTQDVVIVKLFSVAATDTTTTALTPKHFFLFNFSIF